MLKALIATTITTTLLGASALAVAQPPQGLQDRGVPADRYGYEMHIGKRDPYTDGAHGIRQRDPYTDGAHGIRERGGKLGGLNRQHGYLGPEAGVLPAMRRQVNAAPRDRQWKSGNAEFYQVLC